MCAVDSALFAHFPRLSGGAAVVNGPGDGGEEAYLGKWRSSLKAAAIAAALSLWAHLPPQDPACSAVNLQLLRPGKKPLAVRFSRYQYVGTVVRQRVRVVPCRKYIRYKGSGRGAGRGPVESLSPFRATSAKCDNALCSHLIYPLGSRTIPRRESLGESTQYHVLTSNWSIAFHESCRVALLSRKRACGLGPCNLFWSKTPRCSPHSRGACERASRLEHPGLLSSCPVSSVATRTAAALAADPRAKVAGG